MASTCTEVLAMKFVDFKRNERGICQFDDYGDMDCIADVDGKLFFCFACVLSLISSSQLAP